MRKAKNILIPPNIAVGFLCHLSSLGSTTNPYLFDSLIIKGVITSDSNKETENGIRYFIIYLFVPVILNYAFYYPFHIYSWFVAG